MQGPSKVIPLQVVEPNRVSGAVADDLATEVADSSSGSQPAPAAPTQTGMPLFICKSKGQNAT